MQEPIQNHSTTPTALDYVEIGGVVVSIGAAITTIFIQQIAIAAIPLSLTAGLSWTNRRRLANQMAAAMQQSQVQMAQQDRQQKQTLLQQQETAKLQMDGLQTKLDAQAEQTRSAHQTFTSQLRSLDVQSEATSTLLDKLREIDRCTQGIRINNQDATMYYKRGKIRQNLGRSEDKMLAIDDYGQAIAFDAAFGDAYFHRGQLRAEFGEKRLAGEDLRAAAKCYFDNGEMEKYDEAKRLSEQIYEKFESKGEVTEGRLRASDLFA
jgi:hypothetical protein